MIPYNGVRWAFRCPLILVDTMLTLLGVNNADAEAGNKTIRRRWSVEQKRHLVSLTYEDGASVSIIARRFDVNANQLFRWRAEMGRTNLPSVADPAVLFAPIDLVQEPAGRSGRDNAGMMEIELSCGTKVRVNRSVDEAALSRVISACRAGR
jgi:transposase